jgi:hypothetical protein
MTRLPTVVHGEGYAEPLLAPFEGPDFNAVLVVDTEGCLLGMVTKLSLLRLLQGRSAEAAEAVAPLSLRVRDIMDTHKISVEPADSLDVVVRQMTRYRVRSVPVVERAGSRRQLVGMVSRGDLLRGFGGTPAPAEGKSASDATASRQAPGFGTPARSPRAREGCTNPGSCHSLVIFVQQTAQEVPPTHLRVHRGGHRLAGSLGRGQLEPPMWPLGIVVVDEDSEHGLQMPLIQDKEPVQALGPHRPNPAFRVSIRAGRLHRHADHFAGRAAEDLIKGQWELAVPITHEEPVATVELWALED